MLSLIHACASLIAGGKVIVHVCKRGESLGTKLAYHYTSDIYGIAL